MKGEFIGNLGRDAETKTSPDGRSFLTFSVADSYKQNGQEITNWVDCTYNNTNVGQYLKKGAKVFCRGRVTMRQYTKKDGTQGVAFACGVSELEIVSFADKAQPAPGAQTGAMPEQVNADDMPF